MFVQNPDDHEAVQFLKLANEGVYDTDYARAMAGCLRGDETASLIDSRSTRDSWPGTCGNQ
jgi:hypothetical protein